MTTAANRLVQKGYVKREQDPSDGRCFHLHLTDAGRRLIHNAYDEHARNLEKITAVLTDAERTQLVSLLKRIGRHAQSLKALDY